MNWEQEVEEYLTSIQTEIRQSFPKLQSACEQCGGNFKMKPILRLAYRQIQKTYDEFVAEEKVRVLEEPRHKREKPSQEKWDREKRSREKRSREKRSRLLSKSRSRSPRKSDEPTNKIGRGEVSRRRRLDSEKLEERESESGVFSIDKHDWVEEWRKKCFGVAEQQPELNSQKETSRQSQKETSRQSQKKTNRKPKKEASYDKTKHDDHRQIEQSQSENVVKDEPKGKLHLIIFKLIFVDIFCFYISFFSSVLYQAPV